MTEIEKMFKNAGIKKQYCGWLDMGDLDCQPQYVRCNSFAEWKDAVFSSRFGESEEELEHKYPPFTAEKQLELIKWLAGFCVHIDNVGEKINISIGVGYVSYYAGNLADAIALCINSKWNNLTDQEKEEIKAILNEY